MEPNPEAMNLNHERTPEKLLGTPAAKTYLQITSMLGRHPTICCSGVGTANNRG